ncbi:nickel-dependent hydrogenase large subunit [Magnetovibrio blakemorei]|uniref:HupV protein n=1 Tax=Magnetovibrio blakemorei TaxID=28181 RepID=A0A1E5Q5F5_9PROT|nr:nickel-dependent hydrogenase large subunit [Magnetovibrio blakemorei]OEJ65330.1 HupV protein [Magnetovibrio blakemorei]
MTRLLVGPFNRVEGDLEVNLEIHDGQVVEAQAISPLYRGFEAILQGRPALDALVIAPRICGICSVSQSLAAAAALRSVAGLTPPPNGVLTANIAHAAENVADHLTHFYLFFMPDFARDVYAGEAWFDLTAARFKATQGTGAMAWLEQRQRLLHVMGILAGKWPHSLAFQPGGSTKSVDKGGKVRLLSIVHDLRLYLERTLFADTLEAVISLADTQALLAWADQHPSGDFAHFLSVSAACGLEALGQTSLPLMSFGAYASGEGALFVQGVFDHTQGGHALDVATLSEDLTSTWMQGESGHPGQSSAHIDVNKDGAYTWCKAPRLDAKPVEVGALARQAVDAQPLVRDLLKLGQSNVQVRIVARLIETARLVLALEDWVRALQPGEPFCLPDALPESGAGVGLVEAARGSLGHWLEIQNGHLSHYQIIAPTTWNFSPRCASGLPGPLEQALVGTPVRNGEQDPVAVQHVVRSFDPCMVCTVH